jgi:hypothetical protein
MVLVLVRAPSVSRYISFGPLPPWLFTREQHLEAELECSLELKSEEKVSNRNKITHTHTRPITQDPEKERERYRTSQAKNGADEKSAQKY